MRHTRSSRPRRRARYDAQLEDLMWDAEPAPPAGLARAETRPHTATVAHPAAPTPVRVPAVAPAPTKVATAAPSSAREAFSRATASPQPTRTAVPWCPAPVRQPVGAGQRPGLRPVRGLVASPARRTRPQLPGVATPFPGWSSIPRRDHGAPPGALDAQLAQDLAAAAARAEAQSFWNWTMPESVSGWWTICLSTLNGSVATCEPASAASVT